MGYYFYTELGNSQEALGSTGDFQNLQPGRYYLDTDYPYNTIREWIFGNGIGYQTFT